ncbi:MAG: hypothetical protein HQL52_10850 [Magnetococcales bacterium]|nr:hypothetical protein [Magnetococcales bacterium]
MNQKLAGFFHAPNHPFDRWAVWLMLLLGMVGMGLRVWFYQQPANTDDLTYFTYATRELLPSADQIGPGALRSVLIWSIQLMVLLLGPTVEAFYGTIHLHALLSLLAIWFFTKAFSNDRVALLMVVLWVTSYPYILSGTRLLPDNLGISLALLGLGAVAWAGRLREGSPPFDPKALIVAFLGGLLLWAAVSVRVTFAVYVVAGVVTALWSPHRKQVTLFLILGMGLGGLLELIHLAIVFDDPFIRIKALLGYSQKTGRVVGTIFTPTAPTLAKVKSVAAQPTISLSQWLSTLGLVVLRYPKMLYNTGSGEIFFHLFGFLGAMVWLGNLRKRVNPPKIIVFMLAFGFIAFTMKSWHPPVPAMRESVRQYLTVAPLFYLAAVEFFLFLLNWSATSNFRNLAANLRLSWLVRPAPFLILAAPLVLVLFNLMVVNQFKYLAKNGNDAYIATADAIRQDMAHRGETAGTLYLGGGAARVMKLLLPETKGWHHAKMDPTFPQPGYLVMDWRRYNYDDLEYGERTDTLIRPYDHLVEHQSPIFRHRRHFFLTEAYRVGPSVTPRPATEITADLPPGWSFGGSDDSQAAVLSERGGWLVSRGKQLYSGTTPLLERPNANPLPQERLIQVRFGVQMTEMRAGVKVYLLGWPMEEGLDQDKKPPVKRYMGEVIAMRRQQEATLWSWLPRGFGAFRLLFEGSGKPLKIFSPRLFLMEPQPQDRFQQRGGAW